jgi:hypothetical protein
MEVQLAVHLPSVKKKRTCNDYLHTEQVIEKVMEADERKKSRWSEEASKRN